MKAILLAAGYGKRLRPMTLSMPKCLVTINEQPLIDIWLEDLSNAGVGPFLINTHYLAGQVIEHLKSSPFRKTIRLVHEYTLLGTAGTLIANADFVGNDPVMLVHADNLSLFDPKAFIKAHSRRPANCDMTMMLFETDDPKSCGIVELDSYGVVTDFHEKIASPPSNLANGAVYIIEPKLISELASVTPPITDFSTQVIPSRIGRIATYLNKVYHRDIGTALSLREANQSYPQIRSDYYNLKPIQPKNKK